MKILKLTALALLTLSTAFSQHVVTSIHNSAGSGSGSTFSATGTLSIQQYDMTYVFVSLQDGIVASATVGADAVTPILSQVGGLWSGNQMWRGYVSSASVANASATCTVTFSTAPTTNLGVGCVQVRNAYQAAGSFDATGLYNPSDMLHTAEPAGAWTLSPSTTSQADEILFAAVACDRPAAPYHAGTTGLCASGGCTLDVSDGPLGIEHAIVTATQTSPSMGMSQSGGGSSGACGVIMALDTFEKGFPAIGANPRLIRMTQSGGQK